MNGAIVLRADAGRLPLPDASVDLVVTSPPYFALRSYQDGGEHYDGQIGSEPTPQAFLEALWAVTSECVRVLKPSGSIFVNLGDKYAGSGGHNNRGIGASADRGPKAYAKSALVANYYEQITGQPLQKDCERCGATFEGNPSRRFCSAACGGSDNRPRHQRGEVRAKSLMGLPWRYALGCIDQLGLILRAELIWSKPNGLPESVTDRVRRSHEQWFHFTREGRYYADMSAVAAERRWQPSEGYQGHKPTDRGYGPKHFTSDRPQTIRALELAATHGLTEAHREALKARGLGDTRKSAATKNGTGKNTDEVLRLAAEADAALGSYAREFTMHDPSKGKLPDSVWTVPTQPLKVPSHVSIDHFAAFPTEWPRRLVLGWSPPGGVVLDPFGGTGTTAMVARALGRRGVSVDLSADYCRLAKWRIWESDGASKVRTKTNAAAALSLFGEARGEGT